MHIFLCRSSQRQRSVVISLSLIPVVLHSCTRPQSEKHIRPVLFKETPCLQFCVFLGIRNRNCNHQANAFTSKADNVSSNPVVYICFSVHVLNAATPLMMYLFSSLMVYLVYYPGVFA